MTCYIVLSAEDDVADFIDRDVKKINNWKGGTKLKIRKAILMFVLVSLVMLYGGIVQANTISGSLWKVSESVAQHAIPANVPGTTPDVTFDVNSPFNFSGSSVSVGTWLNSSSAFNIVENTAGTLASLMDNYSTGTLVKFTGFVSVTNGMAFSVTHDDGLTLIIGGINLGFSPDPTAPITSNATYTGPSGNYAFELVYTECCSGPAVLQVDLPLSNTPTPLPAAVWLLGTGLVGLVGVKRKFKK